MTRQDRTRIMRSVALARQHALDALNLASEVGLEKHHLRRLRHDYDRLDATFSRLSTQHKTEALT